MVEDARYRIKATLDTYLSAAAITKDDGATAAAYAVIFGAMPSFIDDAELFADSDPVDAVFFIGNFDSEPLIGFDKKAYAYHEIVPIDIITTDKTGIIADKLENKCAQELRRIFETYPVPTAFPRSSVRGIKRIAHAPEEMGGWWLHKATYMIDWTRAQENAAPTVPTFAYGVGYTYEGDRVSGGTEGLWTLTAGGGSTITQTVNSEYNLDLYCTVYGADSSTVHASNIGLVSTTYLRCRARYKTTGSATAKIILTGSTGNKTVLAETSSLTWAVVDVLIGDIGTINTITLYNCDATGHVYYDFVQIYKGNYILPNCISISPPFFLNDVVSAVPDRSGDDTESSGSNLMEIRMTCDLSIEYSTVAWRRPQATAADDYNNFDIFLETVQVQGSNAQNIWTWLDTGTPAMQFKARLAEVKPTFERNDVVELVWREYRHGTAANESTAERFGLNL